MAARKPARPSSFATHRGTAVKRLLIVGVAASVLMMIISNSLEGSRGTATGNPSASGTSTAPAAGTSAAPRAPKIAAAVSNPMDPYRGVNDAATDESSEPQAEPTDPAEYQRMLTTAQDVAVRFGTYDYRDSPQRWVTTLPDLHPKLRAKLLAEARRTWPGFQQGQVIARAQLTGQPPQIVYYWEQSGSAQLVVFTRQEVTGVNGETVLGRSYAVTMRYDKRQKRWYVNGLVGS
jgi:hypothetical protein